MQREWQLNPSSITYREADKLGSGAFGSVYKGVYHGTTDVAVKVLNQQAGNKTQELIEECNLLRTLIHDRIVQFRGACLERNAKFMVTEYMRGGSLAGALRSNPEQLAWGRHGRQILLDVAEGLNYLHSRQPRVLHSDLKPDNILLTEHMRAKIGDVGVSKASDRTICTLVGGSLWYLAPEALLSNHVTTKADVFSFGLMIWQICTGETHVSSYQPLAGRRMGERRPAGLLKIEMPYDAPRVAVDLFRRCTDRYAERRPDAREIFDTLRLGMNTTSPLFPLSPAIAPPSPDESSEDEYEEEEEEEDSSEEEEEELPSYFDRFQTKELIWYLTSAGFWLKGRVEDMDEERIKIWVEDGNVRRLSPEKFDKWAPCIRRRKPSGAYSVPFCEADTIEYKHSNGTWLTCSVVDVNSSSFKFVDDDNDAYRVNNSDFDDVWDRFTMDDRILMMQVELQRLGLV